VLPVPGRPYSATLSVVNATPAPMTLSITVRTVTGRQRTESATIAAWGQYSNRVHTLMGSLVSDLLVGLERVTVVCNGGNTPCAATLLLPASPACRP
jgi:hypothetical protein